MPKFFLLFATIFSCFFSRAQENISITYTGNMGVYITDKQSSVLIDGLHTRYGDDYLFPTAKLVNEINTQLQPDVILFTHYHGDHFSVELAKEYLKKNKETHVFGANQITKHFSSNSNQIHTIATNDYNKQVKPIKKATITGFKVDHVGKRHSAVENVGFIIEISNKKILHVGDTDWLQEINLFDQLKLSEEAIDIAILPYWMLLSDNATSLIKENINTKHIIATHISPQIKKEELSKLKNTYPHVHFFTKLKQQIQL
ncbi:MBL fold metallo-hydrolase [Aquimarina sp. AD10]|uniref:MBL fold metallo-hydrolase n=2 Tax=Aquimarina sp. AD10 TaxID=1714849 RepID=UPI000E542961|nr:MBL fold metallo-hydrolase [Aquimarina sp. AD10]AXT60268.1 MBL fold metallo-hydrolase [Aquimarina sp. AD10]RKN01297.1 MBL fold metallo-hydrolase [Aquimarina sp. AD10]